MKYLIATLILALTTTSAFSQSVDSTTNRVGKIYFVRSTGFTGSAVAFKTFIDGNFVCRLNNNRYSIHEVPVGRHTCSVQFAGTKKQRVG